MQKYLFPLQKTAYPDPWQIVLEKIIPSVKRALFLIDPSPPDELVQAISSVSDRQISRRMLIRRDLMNIGDSSPPDIMKADTRRVIQNSKIDVRSINQLAARLIIFDDSALVISGQYGSGLNWGVELNPSDAQPVIDYWNSVYQGASRISESHAMETWDRYLERLWSGKMDPGEIIGLYNTRGTFIEIQVRIFAGYRQITIYPFSSSSRDSTKGPVIRWKLIHSRHFQALGRQATKIHGLKSLAIVRDTPAGFYLLRSDARSWDDHFRERERDFRLYISQFLDDQYDQIRKEAFDDLHKQFSSVLIDMKNSRQMLPILDEQFIDDEVQELFLKHYPDKQTLLIACHARYILYGLHPDTIRDRKLIESLASSATANVLL